MTVTKSLYCRKVFGKNLLSISHLGLLITEYGMKTKKHTGDATIRFSFFQ